jgi:hypothetical protein
MGRLRGLLRTLAVAALLSAALAAIRGSVARSMSDIGFVD